jgi:tetratricopeptide (TPR) repeat protein
VTAPADPDKETAGRDALIHREVLQVAALILIAVAGFFVTRGVAANNREATFRDAESWYERGQAQLSAGRLDDAVESLRRATVRNRNDRRYALALARALARTNDTEAARAALMTLRETSPEDAEVNLELARLAARRQDVTEAVRFYHNALYAPWPLEAADTRRQVRFELIEFLLQHDQAGRALSELLAVATDLPDDAATRVRAGQLFARAGDASHALEQYERALRLAPDDKSALAGAGSSAFKIGNFALARRYLRLAPDDMDDVARTRAVADLILSNDPLARRIGAAERRRRLTANFDYVQQRLTACLSNRAGGMSDDEVALQREVETVQGALKGRGALDQDAIESGVDLLDRVEQQIARACGPATAWDQALTLIIKQHESETR